MGSTGTSGVAIVVCWTNIGSVVHQVRVGPARLYVVSGPTQRLSAGDAEINVLAAVPADGGQGALQFCAKLFPSGGLQLFVAHQQTCARTEYVNDGRVPPTTLRVRTHWALGKAAMEVTAVVIDPTVPSRNHVAPSSDPSTATDRVGVVPDTTVTATVIVTEPVSLEVKALCVVLAVSAAEALVTNSSPRDIPLDEANSGIDLPVSVYPRGVCECQKNRRNLTHHRDMQGFFAGSGRCGSVIRTRALWHMKPAGYRTAPPRDDRLTLLHRRGRKNLLVTNHRPR